MASDWFKGTPDIPPATRPAKIDSIDRARFFGPDAYDAEPGLADAVNSALLLAQPLLVSGEPGTGKTQLAEKMALELGLPLCKFETRSTSVAQDLFYHFDHVARFQTAQSDTNKAALDPLNFIEFGALGRAIVESLPTAEAATLFPAGRLPDWYGGPRRAIVLIDEIDKAPSDFPNDALNEVERHYFRIREVGGGRVVSAAEALRPIIVITSNSEKQLPDAFLRRCVFFHLQPIEAERLRRIVVRRLAGLQVRPGRLLDEALALFADLRSSAYDLRKRPSTSEFLGFVAALASDGAAFDQALPVGLAQRHLSTLVKAPEDQEAARRHPRLA
ncbi:MoxR family ATPase [Zoogloea sp.]|uniref:AAA family ATPase n=1 Tax=Zoogloea sp. TaxID=49181 RepID=UPI001D8E4B3E|nr:MoxR family ATPase [Zoogloea sp.]MBK6656515.1 AAA family ATPase [Zoogloea sp.]